MLKFIIKIVLILLITSASFAQIGGLPGAFTRMGFGSRGISMGNAMTSVTYGDVVGYYNPALSAFQNEHLINLSYSFLALDRALNFVSYTKNFKLPNQKEGSAGFTFSWINAGVGKIDGRDADGFSIGELSTFENQFMFAPSIRVSEQVSLGAGFKFYYAKLYDNVTTTAFGFDIGGLVKVNDKINVGFAVKDINTKYEWNTTEVYGQLGTTTKEKFPNLYNIGVSYLLPKNLGVASLEFELSNQKTYVIKGGVEIKPIEGISFRGGFDRFDFKSDDKFGNSKFSFGVGYQKSLKNFILGLDYSFVMEPYSNSPFQTITAVFKIK